MSSHQPEENIIVMNPHWTVNPEDRSVQVSACRDSFAAAMRYCEDNATKIGNIMLLTDVPPQLRKAPELFLHKSFIRNTEGRHLGMRHLGMFAETIQRHYRDLLPENMDIEQVRVLTETSVRQIVLDLPSSDRKKMPRCSNKNLCPLPNSIQPAGCLEILITALLFGLDPERYMKTKNLFDQENTTRTLRIFTEPSHNLPKEYIIEGPTYLPEGSWHRTIVG